MDAHLNAEWQARLIGFGWLLAAVLISQIAHYVLYALFLVSRYGGTALLRKRLLRIRSRSRD